MKDAKKYVERYYKGKEVTSITTQPNMLGEPMFEVVKFNNGDYITLARSVNGELFRHSGGGRYGSRNEYEHITPKHKEQERIEHGCNNDEYWVPAYHNKNGVLVHGFCRKKPRT